MAITYAFCCLFFSALNDFIFKLFANSSSGEGGTKKRSCGLFVSIVGLIWFAFTIGLPHKDGTTLQATLLWGAISGFFSLVGNILLIESMGYQSAGVSSTIYRLNMVLVVIGAFLFLGEPLTPTIVAGVVCAFVAVMAFIPKRTAETAAQDAAKAKLGFTLAVLASVLRACMGLSYKYAFSHQADVNGVTALNAFSWLAGGVLYSLIREHKFSLPTKHDWLIGLTSGIFVSGIVFFMAWMNACGNASVVNPIAQMSFLGTFLLSAIFLKEKMTKQKMIAVLFGIVAIIFLTI
ncbi:MAG: DMT family transporter [Victivallales bacterium]|nr:DMT family transporter [Victivallales bacterium]